MAGKRENVLVVEDSLAVAKRLQISLERAGFLVDIARNGAQALTKAQRKHFDLVLTDEQMPVMSGHELCQKLREDERYVNTPVIILTGGRSQLEANDLSEDMHVSAIVDKPFNPESIVRLVEHELLEDRSAR
jgi:two-component system chemotaxis response regulator CheY